MLPNRRRWNSKYRQVADHGEVIILVELEFSESPTDIVHFTWTAKEISPVEDNSYTDTSGTSTGDTWDDVVVGDTYGIVEVGAKVLGACNGC